MLPKPAPKPENIGPTGKVSAAKPDLSFLEKIRPAPGGVYDLEETAGKLFGRIINQNWPESEKTFADLRNIWQKTRPLLEDNGKNEKILSESEFALNLLANAITAKKIPESAENLNKMMTGISKISRNYQLSPVAEIINVGNAVRNAGFYVQNENWPKASSKVTALENTWKQAKPTIEQLGILEELTKTHFIIGQMKESVDAQDKDSFFDLTTDINNSLSKIRNFFYGK